MNPIFYVMSYEDLKKKRNEFRVLLDSQKSLNLTLKAWIDKIDELLEEEENKRGMLRKNGTFKSNR